MGKRKSGKRKPASQLKHYETINKSVSMRIDNLEGVHNIMDKTGESFSEIVNFSVRRLLMKDDKYCKERAKEHASKMHYWNSIAAQMKDAKGGKDADY